MPTPAFNAQTDWALQRIKAVTEVLQSDNATAKDLAAAAHCCEELLQLERANHGVVFLLATTYMKAGKHGISENLFYRALQLHNKLPEAWNNIGFICQTEGRWTDARTAFKRSIAQKPDNIEARSNLSSLYINNGTPAKALKMCDEILREDPTLPDALWNRALALLELSRWNDGWRAYRVGLHMSSRSSVTRKVRYAELPYWNGMPLPEGEKLVVYGEQGVGDEIMGYSMIPDAIKALKGQLVLEVHPRLLGMARRAFPDIHVYGTRKAPEGTWQSGENLTAQIPLLGLGEYFRTSDAAFEHAAVPYIPTDPTITRELGAKPRIGLSWSGGSLPTRADVRSISLREMHDNLISEFGDAVEWVSMQYDPPEKPGFYEPIVGGYERDTGVCLNHDTAAINDLDVGYLQRLPTCDLVVSVCTSLIHAAGATGVPVVVLTPREVAWRYGQTSNRMAWYGDHVTLTRQRIAGDWGVPLNYAKAQIRRLVRDRMAEAEKAAIPQEQPA